MASTTANKSEEQIIRDLIDKVLENIGTKNATALQSLAHPQGTAFGILNGVAQNKNLHEHLAGIVHFPGKIEETIVDGTLEIRVLDGQLAVASFKSEITTDGKLFMSGYNAATFQKVKAEDGGPEEWKMTIISDKLNSAAPSS